VIDDLLDLSADHDREDRLDLQQISILDVVQTALDSPKRRPTPGLCVQASWIRPSIVSADSGRLQQWCGSAHQRDQFTPRGGPDRGPAAADGGHRSRSASATPGIGIRRLLPQGLRRFSQREIRPPVFRRSWTRLAIAKQLVELPRRFDPRDQPGRTRARPSCPAALSVVQLAEDASAASCAQAAVSDRVAQPAGAHALSSTTSPTCGSAATRAPGPGRQVTSFVGAEDALAALQGDQARLNHQRTRHAEMDATVHALAAR